jgi:hypothetical protein
LPNLGNINLTCVFQFKNLSISRPKNLITLHHIIPHCYNAIALLLVVFVKNG